MGTCSLRVPALLPVLSCPAPEPLPLLAAQVPSGLNERVVGYECPEAHQLMWFNLTKGPLHYIPSLDKYFKLVSAN